MSRELRLFGDLADLYRDQDKFLSMATGGYLTGTGADEWRGHDGDRVKWVLVENGDIEWRMQICGLEYSHLTLHTSLGLGITTKEESEHHRENINYAMSRLRYHR